MDLQSSSRIPQKIFRDKRRANQHWNKIKTRKDGSKQRSH